MMNYFLHSEPGNYLALFKINLNKSWLKGLKAWQT